MVGTDVANAWNNQGLAQLSEGINQRSLMREQFANQLASQVALLQYEYGMKRNLFQQNMASMGIGQPNAQAGMAQMPNQPGQAGSVDMTQNAQQPGLLQVGASPGMAQSPDLQTQMNQMRWMPKIDPMSGDISMSQAYTPQAEVAKGVYQKQQEGQLPQTTEQRIQSQSNVQVPTWYDQLGITNRIQQNAADARAQVANLPSQQKQSVLQQMVASGQIRQEDMDSILGGGVSAMPVGSTHSVGGVRIRRTK